jgi:TRAP-type C4-dicarboxylate transport system permease small subunit
MEQRALREGEGPAVAMHLDPFARILKRIESGQLFFCVCCLGAVAVVMFLEVFLRNVLGINLQWALDLSALLMVWTCFIGASVVYRRRGHIGIEALVRFFPLRWQVRVNIAVYLLICAGFVVLILKANYLMGVQYGQEIVSLEIPRSALSLPIVLGIGMMLVTSIYLILEEAQRLQIHPRQREQEDERTIHESP